MSQHYRRDIDGLRTVAVLPVVFGHAGLSLFSGGFVGVDVFFVISGFLITGILLREIEAGAFSLIGFYERRARRILPALFVVMAVCLAMAWFTWSPMRLEDLGTASIATLLFASNILFWIQESDYFASEVLREPLLHTWSLAIEEQFYLFFPLLLWVLAGQTRRRVVAVILALAGMSFVFSVWATYHRPVVGFYLIPSRIWELALGALLALGVFPAIRHRAMAEALAALGLLAIGLSVFFLHEGARFPGMAALPPVLGAVAIIWAGGKRASDMGRAAFVHASLCRHWVDLLLALPGALAGPGLGA
jgi:peptidoglycan/LPS O-acetylase OafA/YrhL